MFSLNFLSFQRASLGKFATSFLILPCGICLTATAFMAFLKVFSAWLTFVGLCSFFSFKSMSLKLDQSALQKLMKVLSGVVCV